MKSSLWFLLAATALHASSAPGWLRLPGAGETPPANVSAWILQDSLQITHETPGSILKTYRRAVMPLTKAGLEDLIADIGFFAGNEELVEAHAWVMSPDGAKHRTFDTDAFLVAASVYSNMLWDLRKQAYFIPQRYLEPGWIFAWEVQIRSQDVIFDVHWYPDRTLPVRRATLELIPLPEGHLEWKAFGPDMPAPTAGKSPGSLVWQLANLPGENPAVPASFERDNFAVCARLLAPDPKSSAPRSWSELVRLVRTQIDPQAVASADLASEATRHLGKGGLWERIRPICRFVQKEVAYLSITVDTDTLAGCRPHPAPAVLHSRYGDCKDKAVLLCTMLRSAGIDSHVLLVTYGAPKRTVADWPSAFFNHAIVAIRVAEPAPAGWPTVHAGQDDYVLFDPTNKTIPLGFLPLRDRGGLGLLLADGVTAPIVIPLPPPDSNTHSLVIHADVAEDGATTVSSTEEWNGLAAVDEIETEESSSRSAQAAVMEKRILGCLPLATGLSWESSIDPPNLHYLRKAAFSAPRFGQRMPGWLMYVAPDLLSLVPKLESWDESTGSDGWALVAPGEYIRELQLKMPAGWEVVDLPEPWSQQGVGGEASVSYRCDGQTVTGEFRLRVNGGLLRRSDFVDCHRLLDSVLAGERRPIILHRVAPAQPPREPGKGS